MEVSCGLSRSLGRPAEAGGAEASGADWRRARRLLRTLGEASRSRAMAAAARRGLLGRPGRCLAIRRGLADLSGAGRGLRSPTRPREALYTPWRLAAAAASEPSLWAALQACLSAARARSVGGPPPADPDSLSSSRVSPAEPISSCTMRRGSSSSAVPPKGAGSSAASSFAAQLVTEAHLSANAQVQASLDRRRPPSPPTRAVVQHLHWTAGCSGAAMSTPSFRARLPCLDSGARRRPRRRGALRVACRRGRRRSTHHYHSASVAARSQLPLVPPASCPLVTPRRRSRQLAGRPRRRRTVGLAPGRR